jgi:hypothetical protein
MKGKSGNGGFKNKLIEHAEKIILGVTVVLLALFFWSALSLKPIESSKSPEQLASIRATAEQKINEGTKDIEPVPPLPPVINAPAEPTLYRFPQVLDENIEPEIIKRREPKLYPVSDLRATATVISVPVIPGETAQKAAAAAAKQKEDELKKKAKAAAKEGEKKRTKQALRANPDAGYSDQRKGKKGSRSPAYPNQQPSYPSQRGADMDRDTPSYPDQNTNPDATTYSASMPGVRPGPPINPGGAIGETRYAVVLTGRIPFGDQFKAFRAALDNADVPAEHSSQYDNPDYYSFEVERQVVGEGAEAKWEKVDVESLMSDERRWATQPMPDNVVPVYLHQVMTFPMTPAAVRDWQRAGTHPGIPLVFHQDKTTAADTGLGAGSFDAVNRFKKGIGADGESVDTDGGPRRATRDGETAEGEVASLEQVAATPYYLFRFTDSQPTEATKGGLKAGKTYRYRVRMEIANPNFNLPAAILEDPASRNEETKWTEWTVTSETVTIPGEKELLAYGLKAGSLIEARGKFQFHVWDRKLGAEVAHDFELRRGEIADFVYPVKDHYNPYQDTGAEIPEFQFHYEPTEGGIPFLADIRGGDPIPGMRGKDVVQPAELLFIDAEGRLFTTSEATDGPTARDYDKRYAAAPTAAATDGGALFGSEIQEGGNMDRARPIRRGGEERR